MSKMPDARESTETLTRDAAREKSIPNPAAGASQRIAQYDLRREIGRGGMSVVYQARDIQTGQDVALKLLTLPGSLTTEEASNLTARFERGARTVARLSHPNIVSISEVGAHQGRHFVAMEYLRGQTLRERMGGRKLTTREVCSILTQIARALKTAHSTGIVHRDLKPTNIMLLPNGTLKLLDFGIAPSSSETTVADAGILTGSPSRMAPEQVSGKPESAATDIWALGVLSCEMLTGRLPFSGQTAEAILDQVLNQPPAPMPDLPEAVQKVLHRALDKSPSLRYPSASTFVQALNAALTQSVPAAPKPVSAAPSVKPDFVFESAVPKPAAPSAEPDFVFEPAVPNVAPERKSDPPPAPKHDVPPPSFRYGWPVGAAMGLLFVLAFCSAFYGRQQVSELGQHVSHLGGTAAPSHPSLSPVPPASVPTPLLSERPEAQVVSRPEAQVVSLRHQAAVVKEQTLPPLPEDPLPQAVPNDVPVQPDAAVQAAIKPVRRPLVAVVVKRIVRPVLVQVAVRPVLPHVSYQTSAIQAPRPVVSRPIAAQMAAPPVLVHSITRPVSVQTVDRTQPVQNTTSSFTLPSDPAGYDPEAEARQRKSAWSQNGSAVSP